MAAYPFKVLYYDRHGDAAGSTDCRTAERAITLARRWAKNGRSATVWQDATMIYSHES